MYALAAREKLHKQQKKAYEERHSPNPKKKKDKPKKLQPGPVTVNREAKVSVEMARSCCWSTVLVAVVMQGKLTWPNYGP